MNNILRYFVFAAGKTTGLFGNFDGNPDNDLITPDGRVLPPTTAERDIFNEFLACVYYINWQLFFFFFKE